MIGWTPLHWACSKGLKNSVSALLENGADPNKVIVLSIMGTRPLHYAVQYGRTKAMQWMCKEGCDVDAPNVAGWSPLHFAVRHGRVHAAHMLLDLGAVANMPDKSGHTPEVVREMLAETMMLDERFLLQDLARITKDKIKKGILHLEESVIISKTISRMDDSMIVF
uniref:Uncharacterized protein n=1 Tax=Guillardia theta (strain CCMP2712) TaxID=905079 RepID=A0A0C3TNK4_GUITC